MKTRSIIFLLLLQISLFSCSFKKDDSVPSNISTPETHLTQLWETFYLHLDTNNPDSALHYAELVKSYSTREQNKNWLAKANKAIGYVLGKKGKIKESTYYYLDAARLFKETGDLKNLADTYTNLGAEFYNNQDYHTSVSYYEKANEIYHYEGSASDKALAFRGIALGYKKLKNFEKAAHYLQLGKELAENTEDFYNLGLIYNTWGNISLEQKDYNTAHNYFFLTLRTQEKLSDNTELKAIASHNIGETYFLQGEHSKAKEWLKKSIIEKNKLNDPLLAQSSYLLLSKIFVQENRNVEGIATLEEGLQKIPSGTVDNSINESLALLGEALTKVSENPTPSEIPDINRKLLNYNQKLLAYNRNVSETKERLEAINQQQAIQDAIEKHTLNEQIAEYEKRNTYIQYAFFIPVFFLICASVSVYLSFRRNKEYKKLYLNIEEILNKRKPLRHLNKK